MSEPLWQRTLERVQEELKLLFRSGDLLSLKMEHVIQHAQGEPNSFKEPEGDPKSAAKRTSGYVLTDSEIETSPEGKKLFKPARATRTYRFQGQDKTISLFVALAVEASQTLNSLPSELKKLIWRDWPDEWSGGSLNNPHPWINATAELGWRNHCSREFAGSPLLIDRYTPVRALPMSLNGLDELIKVFRIPQRVVSTIRRDCWFAKFDKPILSFIQMIDICLTLEKNASRDGENGDEQRGENPSEKFLLTPMQKSIWEALQGTALRVEPLARKVSGGDTGRLYKAGLKTQLCAVGIVKYQRGLGYYRPDAPPVEFVAEK